MSIGDICRETKDYTKGNVGKIILVGILFALIQGACNGVIGALFSIIKPLAFLKVPLSGIITYILICANSLAISNMYLGIVDEFVADSERYFSVLKDVNMIVKAIVLEFKIFLKVLIPTILTLGLGLPIFSIKYGMARFIFLDDTSLSPKECIAMSKDIMTGNCMKMFLMELRYSFFISLSSILLFIPAFWLIPRMGVAHAVFYRDLVSAKQE